MGSDMEAFLENSLLDKPERLSNVPAWFEEWETVLSRFRINSELTRLNQKSNVPVHVSPILWDVFEAACAAEKMTDGLVTPTVLEALTATGYRQSFETIPASVINDRHPEILPVPSLLEVISDPAAKTIQLPEGIGLDFGGVAKGWAAHQTMSRLRESGPSLVNAAGDIAISAPCSDGRPWIIGVKNPWDRGEDLEFLKLAAGGVATSGRDRRVWRLNNQWQHHLIDPLTGMPAETDVLTASVIAPTVMEAEAAAKAAFLLGSRDGMDWIEARAALAGILILEDGRMIYSKKMKEYL